MAQKSWARRWRTRFALSVTVNAMTVHNVE